MESAAFVQLLIFALVVTAAAAADAQKAIGDACEGKDGAVSICRPIADCPAALDTIRQGGRPSICVYDGFTPVVCCPGAVPAPAPTPATDAPQLDRSSSERVATRMCTKYGEAVYTLDSPSSLSSSVKEDQCAVYQVSLVPENRKARANEFPHMALLGYIDDSLKIRKTEWSCAGSLISERFVLTVAHCLFSSYGRPKTARLGERDLNTANELNKYEDYEVVEGIPHPEYKEGVFYNDIALLRLARDVTFTASIRPACLHTQKDIGTQRVILSGWGREHSTNRELHHKLRKAHLLIRETEVCTKAFSTLETTYRLRNGINEELMMCAQSERGDQDECTSVSGGPIQVILNSPYCMYSLVGLTSFGSSICRPPSVYTRISHYVPWIAHVVWPKEK